ncbi:hypothetical protein C1H46_004359 [Malus baccata]|uniref:Uncharacterized protein n=1 Tax=Malus baccata TaxID=106549 RepID=A0A540NGC6_MALBA|nr:hypothetical protein C1H46_004359 [Malus baccata]
MLTIALKLQPSPKFTYNIHPNSPTTIHPNSPTTSTQIHLQQSTNSPTTSTKTNGWWWFIPKAYK